MKTILCYGDSNLRGFIPDSYNDATGLSGRFGKDVRWTGVLQNKLGSKVQIIEEGLNGRTTAVDETVPGRPFRNGLAYLPLSLESHFPIDLVIFMLGLNDTKTQFNRSAVKITQGMRDLIRAVKTSDKGPNGAAPLVLVIASPYFNHAAYAWDDMLDESALEKSKQLPALYKKLALTEQCEFFDASSLIQVNQLEGVHFDKESHQKLGNALAEIILRMT